MNESPPVFALAVFLLGLCVGSFLNVVIHRFPKMLDRQWRAQCLDFLGQQVETATPEPAYNLVVPRSACPACGHRISALQNIPVVSYLWLRGKCASCKAKIGWRYPFVELLTGVLSAYVAWHFSWGVQAVWALLFLWVLLALTFIDADTQLLPDDITFPLLWAGLLINAFGTFTDLRSAVLGAVFGYLVLWGVYWSFKLLTGKEGMGYGDFKLLAALGAWMGWQLLPLLILVSAAVGAVAGLIGILLVGKEKGARIPFGPYLAVAGFIALLWGRQLNDWYLGRMPG